MHFLFQNAWPSLRTFEMVLCEWPSPISRNGSLGRFPLGIDSEDLYGLIPCCLGGAPNLTSFHLCPGTLLPRGFFRSLVRGCPFIEVVIIDALDFSSHPDLPELSERELKEIKMRRGFHFEPLMFSQCLRGQKKLKALDLRGNIFDHFPLDLLRIISSNCPNISEIQLLVARENIPAHSVISDYGFSFSDEALQLLPYSVTDNDYGY